MGKNVAEALVKWREFIPCLLPIFLKALAIRLLTCGSEKLQKKEEERN